MCVLAYFLLVSTHLTGNIPSVPLASVTSSLGPGRSQRSEHETEFNFLIVQFDCPLHTQILSSKRDIAVSKSVFGDVKKWRKEHILIGRHLHNYDVSGNYT
jgi:hypothetical protein